jgi:lambda family phage tail tape measure protein
MAASFLKGGDNENVDAALQAKMMEDARKRDSDARQLDMARMLAASKQQTDEMLFQQSLYGKSNQEVQKLTEFRKIDLRIQELMVGATEEQILKYQQLGVTLKESIGKTLDEIFAKQQDVFGGMHAGVTKYLDSIRDRAGQMEDFTVNSLRGMEDAFVQFAETGKLSFKDLAKSMVSDLVRIIMRYMILMVVQRMTGIGGNSQAAVPANPLAAYGGPPGDAYGNAWSNGSRKFFANGGVFNSLTHFPMRGGQTGVLGEAGPEAVMPLARTAGGKLGVTVAGSGNASAPSESVLNLTVEVYQGEGDGIRAEQSNNGDKGEVLKLFLGEVSADIQRGGQVAQSITRTFGVKRAAKSYA